MDTCCRFPAGQILYTDWIFPGLRSTRRRRNFHSEWYLQSGLGTANRCCFDQPNERNHATLYGFRLAGMSEGGAYGDDYQPSTNYALVRLTNNATGHVFYCRTHNPSSYAVQSPSLQYTKFDVPAEPRPASAHCKR